MDRKAFAAILIFVALLLSAQFALAADTTTTQNSSDKECPASSKPTSVYAGMSKPATYTVPDPSDSSKTITVTNLSRKSCTQSCGTDGGGTIKGTCVSAGVCEAETTCSGQAPQKVTTQQIQNAINGTASQSSGGTSANATVSRDFQDLSAGQSQTGAQTGTQIASQSGSSDQSNPSSNLPIASPPPSWLQQVSASPSQNVPLPYANQSILTQALNSLEGNAPANSNTTNSEPPATTPEQYLQSTFGTTPSGSFQSSGVTSDSSNYLQTLPSGDQAYIIPPNDPLNQQIQDNLANANAITGSDFSIVTKLSDGSLALLPGNQYGISGSGYAGVNASDLKSDNLNGTGLNYPFIALGLAPQPQAVDQKLDYMLEGQPYYGDTASNIFSSQNPGTGATAGQDLAGLMSKSSSDAGFGTWLSDNVSLSSPSMAVSGSITTDGQTSPFSSNQPIPTGDVPQPAPPTNYIQIELPPPSPAPDTASVENPPANQTITPPLPNPINVPDIPEPQPIEESQPAQSLAQDQTQNQTGSQPGEIHPQAEQNPAPASNSGSNTPGPQDQGSGQKTSQGGNSNPAQSSAPPSNTSPSAPAQSGGGTNIASGATGGSPDNSGGFTPASASDLISFFSGLLNSFTVSSGFPQLSPAQPITYSATAPILTTPAASEGIFNPCSAQAVQNNALKRAECNGASYIPTPVISTPLPIAAKQTPPSGSSGTNTQPQTNGQTQIQTIIPGKTQQSNPESGSTSSQFASGQTKASQPSGAVQNSNPPVQTSHPSQNGGGNNTPVNPSGTKSGPTGTPNPNGSQKGGTGAPSTTPGNGTSQPTGQAGQGRTLATGANGPGPASGAGSQPASKVSTDDAQPHPSLFWQVMKFISDSIITPANATENITQADIARLNDAIHKARAGLTTFKNAGANLSNVEKASISSGKAAAHYLAQGVNGSVNPDLKKRINQYVGQINQLDAMAANCKNPTFFVVCMMGAGAGDIANKVKGTGDQLLNDTQAYVNSLTPNVGIGAIGKAPSTQPTAVPIAANAANEPNPNPIGNPGQNNSAPAAPPPQNPLVNKPATIRSPTGPIVAELPGPDQMGPITHDGMPAQQAASEIGKVYYTRELTSFDDFKCASGTCPSGQLGIAHRTWPLGSTVEVCNTINDACKVATIIDRGPAPWLTDRTIDANRALTNAIGLNGRNPATYKLLTVPGIATTAQPSGVALAPCNYKGCTSPSPNPQVANARVSGVTSVPDCSGQSSLCASDPTTGAAFTCQGDKKQCLDSLAQQLALSRLCASNPATCNANVTSYTEKATGNVAPLSTQQIQQKIDDYLWSHMNSGSMRTIQAAAAQAGMNPEQYAIGGMDPNFKTNLFFAGQAMDKAGVQWGIENGFRDDYNQQMICGSSGGSACAPPGWSYHGGSEVTGGYGHGMAADITGPGQQWLLRNGQQFGIGHPYSMGYDAPHFAPTVSREYTSKQGQPSVNYQSALAQEKSQLAALFPQQTYELIGPDGNPVSGANGQQITTTQAPSADGTGKFLTNADGTLQLDQNGQPIPVTPPQLTQDQNNPDQYNAPDDRPERPKPANPWPGQVGNPYVVTRQIAQQNTCLISTQPIIAVPCSSMAQAQRPLAQPIQVASVVPVGSRPYIPPIMTPTPGTLPTSTPPSAAVAITASPGSVASGGSSKISWSSVNASSCTVVTSSGFTIGTTTKGSVVSPKLSTTTQFTAQCQTLTNSTISTSTSVLVQ